MNQQEKIQWMALWTSKNKVTLDLEGECGFGRECVGITIGGSYPDYQWYDDNYSRTDENGEVWTPVDAYHKHECVAVLGRGEEAEDQLYNWLKWFDDNNFGVETGMVEGAFDGAIDPIIIMLGQHKYSRMVKQSSEK